MNKKGLSPAELLKSSEEFDPEIEKRKIMDKVNKFKKFIMWSDEQLDEYRKLYNNFIDAHKIKDNMQQGLEFETARRQAYRKYKKELEVIKGERNSSKNK